MADPEQAAHSYAKAPPAEAVAHLWEWWAQPLGELPLPELHARLQALDASLALHGLWPQAQAEYAALFGDSPPHRPPTWDAQPGHDRLQTARNQVAQAYDERRKRLVETLIADRLRRNPDGDLVDLTRDTRALKDDELEMAYAPLLERLAANQVTAVSGASRSPLEDHKLRNRVSQIRKTYADENDRGQPTIREMAQMVGLSYDHVRHLRKDRPEIFGDWVPPRTQRSQLGTPMPRRSRDHHESPL